MGSITSPIRSIVPRELKEKQRYVCPFFLLISGTRRCTLVGGLILIFMAFITGNSSLEPLLEGLLAQIHIDLSSRFAGKLLRGKISSNMGEPIRTKKGKLAGRGKHDARLADCRARKFPFLFFSATPVLFFSATLRKQRRCLRYTISRRF